MTFGELESRLLACLNRKVQRGEISERQLARLSGYAQSHVHNVLKRARGLNAVLADAMLGRLRLSVEDLLADSETAPRTSEGSVAVWSGAVGPCDTFPDRAGILFRCRLPSSFVSRFGDPVLVQLGENEDSMGPLLEPGDWALVDRDERLRQSPVFNCIYVIAIAGRGAVCRCQKVGSWLVLVTENPHPSSSLPSRLSLAESDILDVVKGKLVWACRNLDGTP